MERLCESSRTVCNGILNCREKSFHSVISCVASFGLPNVARSFLKAEKYFVFPGLCLGLREL